MDGLVDLNGHGMYAKLRHLASGGWPPDTKNASHPSYYTGWANAIQTLINATDAI